MSIDFSGENGPAVSDDSNTFAPRPVWDSSSKRRRGRANTSRTTSAPRMNAAAAPMAAEADAVDTPAGSETAFGDPAVRTTTTSTRARSGVPAGALIAGAAVLVLAGGVAWYATQHQTSTGVAQLTPGVPAGGGTSTTTTTQSTQTAQNTATPTMPTTLSGGASHSLHIATNTAPVHTHAAVSATHSSSTRVSARRSGRAAVSAPASTDAGMNASATVSAPAQRAYTPPPPASTAPVNPGVAPVTPAPAPQPSTTVQPATPSMSTAPATSTGPDTAAQPSPSTGATGTDTGSTGGTTTP